LNKFFKIVYSTKIDFNLINKYIDWFENLVLDHGYDRAAKIANSLAGYALRYSVSHTSSNVPTLSTLERSNVPKVLKPFLHYLRGTIGNINAAHTILCLHRLYGVGQAKPDISGIVKEGVLPKDTYSLDPDNTSLYTGKYFDRLYQHTGDDKFIRYKRAWSYVLEQEFPARKQFSRMEALQGKASMHISSKMGPNGPCFAGSPLDAKALMEYKMSNGDILFDVIEELAYETSNSSLIDYMNHIRKVVSSSNEEITTEEVYTGRLSIKQEHSGKSRIIAIVDQFTQSCLKCMHEHHFEILDGYKEDGTKDQEAASEIARQMTLEACDHNTIVSSQDLTEATNALPMDLQIEIISQMYGNKVAKLWYRISCDREFYYPAEDRMIRYAVGNGMGTYTSWSMLALTNHMIARTAMLEAYVPYQKDLYHYLIIGDDFCCRNIYLAEVYSDIFQSIGVTISVMKGYTFRTSEYYIQYGTIEGMPQVVELAKRVYLNGWEITAIRPKELFEFFGEPIHFTSVVNKVFSRNFYTLDCKKLTQLADLTYQPEKALACAVSPRLPVSIIDAGYCELDFSNKITDILYSESPLSDELWKEPRLSSQILKFGEITFDDYSNAIAVYISSLIAKRLKDPIRTILKISDIPLWSFYEDRPDWFIDSLYRCQSTTALMILDTLMLWVVFSIFLLIEKIIDRLSTYDGSPGQMESLFRLCTGSQDLYLLLGKKKSPPIEVQYSRFVRDIDESINNIDYRYTTSRILFFEWVQDLINNVDEPRSIGQVIDPTVKDNLPKNYFINSREGFLLTLSPEVRKAMLHLENKFKFKVEGHALSGRASLPPKLMAEVLKIELDKLKLNQDLRGVDLINQYSSIYGVSDELMPNPMIPSIYLE